MSAADPTSPEPSNSVQTAAARALPWVTRVAWSAVAVVGGSAIESVVVDDRSAAVRTVAAVGTFATFGIVMFALLLPSVLSLTVARVGAPLALAAAVGTAFAGASATDVGLLAIPALVAVAAVFTADVGRWMVQASAYGDEDRLPLRSPAATGAAAVVSWAVWASSMIAGPLLLAAKNLIGVPILVVAVVATVFVAPRWHQMSRRWLVLVPAGLVVHDPIVLADTLMVRTDQLAGIGLARADTAAADLTGPASGYALEVATRESVSTVFAFTPAEPNGKAIHMTSFLVAPSRPGEALRLASARNLPIT